MRVFSFLGDASPDYRSIMEKQQDFVAAGKSIPIQSLVIAEQTHSSLVHECRPQDSGAGIGDQAQIPLADGFITDIPGQHLLIRTADCTPVLIWDPVKLVVCALHSGREGTRKNIAGQAVKQMIEHYGCRAEDLIAEIGAGICEAHYEVSTEIYEDFLRSFLLMGLEATSHRYRHLDVSGCIHSQLLQAGIPEASISLAGICTYESPTHFSYRRDQTRNRQINLIGLEL